MCGPASPRPPPSGRSRSTSCRSRSSRCGKGRARSIPGSTTWRRYSAWARGCGCGTWSFPSSPPILRRRPAPGYRWCGRSSLSSSCWAVPTGSGSRSGSRSSCSTRSEEHSSELQSHVNLVCRLLLEKKNKEWIRNGEIYSAENDRDHAAIIYKFARQLVEREPDLAERLQIVPSTKTMVAKNSGSVYRAISHEAGTKHGYLPSVVIYDELAQARDRDLYDVLDTSFGARREPLFITISTQSNDPEHVLSKLIDDGIAGLDPSIICHLYAADEDCALDDERQWRKANPALDVFRDREDLATQMAKAMRMPSEEPKVRNLLLNQRVAP